MSFARGAGMVPDEGYIRDLTRDVWANVLQLEIADGAPGWPNDQGTVSAVEVTGQWDGTVSISFPDGLGRRITSAMFACPEEEATADLVRDALGELANVIGGNVKALLPGPSRLSLPTVRSRSQSIELTAAHEGHDIWFVCEGSPLCVTVRTRTATLEGAEGVSP